MKQTAVQFKIIIVFLFAVVGIFFAGGIAWNSLNHMLDKIDGLARPNPKLRLINNINNEIFHLNQVYRSYSFYNSEEGFEQQQLIIDRIKQKVDSVQQMDAGELNSNATLSDIKKQLDEIEIGTIDLIEARKKNNVRTASSKIIRELSLQLNSHKKPDSSYIIKKKTSEVRVSNYTLQRIDSLANTQDPGNRSVFKKLASFFRKKTPKPTGNEVVYQPLQQVDTVIKSSVDSINVFTNAEMIYSLQDYLRELYKAEIESIRSFNEIEKKIQSKNAELLDSISELLARVRKENQEKKAKMIDEAYVASEYFNRVLSFIIVFFVAIGLVMLYLLLRDIRRMRYYQNQLELEKEKAQNVAKARQEFLASMSHEIRSPLTSIIGYSDLLDDNSEYPQVIKNMSEHLLKIVNEVLDIAKIDAGIIEIRKEQVNLFDFLNNVHLGFQLKINEKGLADIVNIKVPEELTVYTDSYRLNQIVYNLLHNAIKFTDSGSVTFKAVTTDVSEDEVMLVISVQDTGKGIPKMDQQRIFDNYQQAGSAADKQNGVGLGLGIVRRLVTMLGGIIELESEQGKGSTFKLTFWLNRRHTLPELVPVHVLHYSPDLFKGKNILVVDDDVWILKLNKIILESVGATVVTTPSPLNSIEIIREQEFDLALIDIQMAEMSGIKLRGELKAIDPELKIIASTANVLLTRDQSVEMRDFKAILHKPFHKSELIDIVATKLEITVKSAEIVEEADQDSALNSQENLPFDLSDFKRFTMGDEVLMKEILQEFYSENKNELAKAEKFLKAGDQLGLAEIIHKLVSRFGQIQVKQDVDNIRTSEVLLRENKYVDMTNLSILIQYWKNINEELKVFLGI